MSKWKRFLSLLLALVLIVGTVSADGIAVQASESESTEEEAESEDSVETADEDTQDAESEDASDTIEEDTAETAAAEVSDEDADDSEEAEDADAASEDDAAEAEDADTEAEEAATETDEADAAAEEDVEETEDEETQASEGSVSYAVATDTLADSEDLFASYVEQELYGDSSYSLLADYGSSYLTGTNLTIYTALKSAVITIAAEGGRAAEIQISLTDEDETISVEGEFDSEDEFEDAVKEVVDKLFDETLIIGCLTDDCPYEMYWYDKSAGVSFQVYYTAHYDDLNISDVGVYVTFAVAEDYQDSSDSSSVDADKATAVATTVAKALEVVSEYADASDLEKLIGYKEYICSVVSYNYDASEGNYTSTYGDPWQIIYVFDEDEDTTVVCEGYSKAFQYLCDLTDFDDDSIVCYTVEGTMDGGTGAGSHMWNIVQIDGENYLVDVTNSDDGTIGQGGELFLTGDAEGSVSGGYTITIASQSDREIIYTYDEDVITQYRESILALTGSGESWTITAEDQEVTYAGTRIDVSSLFEFEQNEDIVIYTLTDGSDYASLSGSYLTITKADMDFEITVSVQAANGYAAATATATLTVNKGTGTGSVTISPAEDAGDDYLTYKSVDISMSFYTGTNDVENRTLLYTSTDGAGYSSSSFPSDAGDYLLTVTFAETDLYNACTATTTFTIEPADLSGATVTLSSSSCYYDGTAKKPTVTVEVPYIDSTDSSEKMKTLTEGADYSVSYANNTNIGTATVTVTGTGNYTGSVSKTFTIKSLNSVSITATNQTVTYSGSTIDVSSIGLFTFGNSGTVSYSMTAGTGAGTLSGKTLTVTKAGTFYITVTTAKDTTNGYAASTATATLTVNKGTGTAGSITFYNSSKSSVTSITYGDIYTYGYTVTSTNPTVSSITWSSGSAPNNTSSVGTYTLTIVYAATDLYNSCSTSKTLTITARSVSSATVTLSNTSYTYTGSACKPGVSSVKLSWNNGKQDVTKTLTSGTDYTISYSNNTNAGTATVTVTGKGNYTGTVKKTFTISARSISSASVTLSGTSYTYTGSARKPSVSSVKLTLNGSTKTLTSGTDYTVSYSNNTNAGTATVTVTGKGNYTGTAKATFTINAKSISSGSVTLSKTSYTYSGSARKPSTTVKVTVNGSKVTLKKGTDYTVTYSNNTKIGKATVTIKGTGNYKGTLKKTFKIIPKTVTVKSVKSSSSKKITVKWSKVSGSVTGYQIRYRLKGSSSWTTVTVKSSSTVSKTISKLKSKKTYYVQVRAYKTVSGTKYYGSWSSSKTVKVK